MAQSTFSNNDDSVINDFKRDPEIPQSLRESLKRVNNTKDSLGKECLLIEEAKKENILPDSYRRLYELWVEKENSKQGFLSWNKITQILHLSQ